MVLRLDPVANAAHARAVARRRARISPHLCDSPPTEFIVARHALALVSARPLRRGKKNRSSHEYSSISRSTDRASKEEKNHNQAAVPRMAGPILIQKSADGRACLAYDASVTRVQFSFFDRSERRGLSLSIELVIATDEKELSCCTFTQSRSCVDSAGCSSPTARRHSDAVGVITAQHKLQSRDTDFVGHLEAMERIKINRITGYLDQ